MSSQAGPSVSVAEDRNHPSEGEDSPFEEDAEVEDNAAEFGAAKDEEKEEKKGRVRRKTADIVKLYGCPKCDKTYSALKVTGFEASIDPFVSLSFFCWDPGELIEKGFMTDFVCLFVCFCNSELECTSA